MWRSYLTVGIRSLLKDSGYTAINIAGLAIGMAACLMILLYVRHEASYDTFLPEADSAYQFQTLYHRQNTGVPNHIRMASFVAKQALTGDFPEIEKAVFVTAQHATILRDDHPIPTEDFLFVDGPITDILRFPYVEGNPDTALDAPGSLLLSESEARRLFGEQSALGRMLTIASRGQRTDYRVTGVFRDIPTNSHFAASYIARFDPHAYFADNPKFLTSWGWQSGWIYLRLSPGADAAALNRALPAWEKRHIPSERLLDEVIDQVALVDYAIVNVRDIHLGEAQNGAMRQGNSRESILSFAAIALLVLAMACVNFVNLATARAGQRAREVAMRKVLGARRWQLIVQFIGESIAVAAVAMLLALTIAELALPFFGGFLGADLSISYFGADGILLPVIALTLLVGVLGGAYPALHLSRFQPARVLKANKSAADAEGSGRLRNALVIAQFAASIGLMICTAVTHAQTSHARTADPGFAREGMLQITGMDQREVMPRSEELKRAIAGLDGVVSVGRSQIAVATGDNRNRASQIPGTGKLTLIGNYFIDEDFFRTMGMRMIAGRPLDAALPMDDSTTPVPEVLEAERALERRGANTVANESAVRRLGFRTAADAIGKRITVSSNLNDGALPLTIVGVVSDARFRTVRIPVDAILFQHHRFGHGAMVVRYTGDPARVRQRIEAEWRRILPQIPFEAKFTEDIMQEAYKAEDARGRIFAAASLLAILIGCLGLFGLAAFTAERRTREIGIRKVLGASTPRIVRLLVWQFSRPVLVANLIAWPVAWWAMRRWLAGFDSHVTLTPLPFVLSGAAALVIATATIAVHAVRVARTNPVNALRYE